MSLLVVHLNNLFLNLGFAIVEESTVNTTYSMSNIQKCQYSKNAINRAGDSLREYPRHADSIEKLADYRECHQYPLEVISKLAKSRLKKIGINPITVATRLKRLPTIIDKLNRNTLDGKQDNRMNLSRMDDIAGCRVVLNSIEDVKRLTNSLKRNSASHEVKIKDYIHRPKKSGYRSTHIIFNCFQSKKEHDSKSLRVELQIRTKAQHAWATAVEIVDIFEDLDLKTNINTENKNWRDFFTLVSTLISNDEESNLINRNRLKDEHASLLKLQAELNAIQKIQNFKELISILKNKEKFEKNVIYFLRRDKEKKVSAEYITNKSFNKSYQTYQALEERQDVLYTALVNTESFKSFRAAYPNFFADADYFINLYKRVMVPVVVN